MLPRIPRIADVLFILVVRELQCLANDPVTLSGTRLSHRLSNTPSNTLSNNRVAVNALSPLRCRCGLTADWCPERRAKVFRRRNHLRVRLLVSGTDRLDTRQSVTEKTRVLSNSTQGQVG